MSQTIDKILEAAENDPYAFGPGGVKKLAAEVRWLRDELKTAGDMYVRIWRSAVNLREREKVLTEALETAREAMKERRDYCDEWEWKYKDRWDMEDDEVHIAIASGKKEPE